MSLPKIITKKWVLEQQARFQDLENQTWEIQDMGSIWNAIYGLHSGIPACCVAHFTQQDREGGMRFIAVEQRKKWRDHLYRHSLAALQAFDATQYVMCDRCCNQLCSDIVPPGIASDGCWDCLEDGESLLCRISRFRVFIRNGTLLRATKDPMEICYESDPGLRAFITALTEHTLLIQRQRRGRG